MKRSNRNHQKQVKEYSITELTEDPTFRNWVEGRASEDEVRYWDYWVTSSESRRHKALLAQQHILSFSVKESVTREDEAYRQKQRLEQRLRCSSAVFRKRMDSNNYHPTRLYKVAAGIAIAASMLFTMQYLLNGSFGENSEGTWNEVVTEYGERKTITLFSGSEIELNTNSTLEYPAGTVDLDTVRFRLEGEAYFSVETGGDSRIEAFSVHTPDGEVQVLGTEFVVSTGSFGTRVVLERGSLDVLRSDHSTDRTAARSRLQEAELAEFSSSGEAISVKQVNPEVYTSWRQDRFVFEDTDFPEVLKRIERTFNVEVQLEDESLLDRSLTGTVATRELGVLIDYIAQAYQIDAVVMEQEDRVIFGRSNSR